MTGKQIAFGLAAQQRERNVEEQVTRGAGPGIELTASLVAAYVSNNHVQVGELPGLIAVTHSALAGLGQPAAPAEAELDRPTPAQIRKSITPDALISFIDGKPYKTLKRHLFRHGFDAYGYRERFGLPSDYPMVAATYAAQRSELARGIGLGRKAAATMEPMPVATSVAPEEPTKRGRPRKAVAA